MKKSLFVFLFSTLLYVGCASLQNNYVEKTEPTEKMTDFQEVPGVVIDHIPADSGKYIGSPSIEILPDGDYVASHDIFGPQSTYNRTLVFLSKDKGISWEKISEIEGQFWSNLFFHQGKLYIMGTSGRYGNVIIRKSNDNGKSWTNPKDENSGILLKGIKYHTAPVPIITHNGRIWRGFEDAMGPDGWGRRFRAFMMTAPEDSNLLLAKNWSCSDRLGWDPKYLNGKFGGWLEGNAVVTPDGEIVDILRVDYRPEGGKAAVINISEDGKKATFNPTDGFINFPGGCKKFNIRFDSISGLYWSLTNFIPDRHKGGNPERTRNTLALISSPDLKSWTVRSIILYHPDVEKHGFQYSDWRFEGNDIIAVCRTAYDDGMGGAHNQHNANFMTFHRINNFREEKKGFKLPKIGKE